eukprot:Skav236495  [mRNA]  locus=scaffold1440:328390:330090:+ [translate_table: standard]
MEAREEYAHVLQFPMYVVKVSQLLQMRDAPESHTSLRQKGLLFEWQPGMFVIFVSHQWLSNLHPDPKGYKLHVLQQCFRNVLDGSLSFGLDSAAIFTRNATEATTRLRQALDEAYIWYDWFSIPQIVSRQSSASSHSETEMVKAVQSIPGYVERCQGFVALTPERNHDDTSEACNFQSWLSRGWCQSELLFHLLGQKEETLVVFSPMHVEVRFGLDWHLDRVGRAEFTVETDRAIVQKLLESTIDKQIHHPNCPLSFKRFLVANRRKLHSLGNHACTTRSIGDFLADFNFSSLKEAAAESTRMTGLLCAIMSGDARMVQILIQVRACLECKSDGLAGLGHVDGLNPLIIAAKSQQEPQMLSTLLELRADITAQDSTGLTVASWVQSPEQVRTLAAAGADFHSLQGALKVAPLSWAAAFADASTVAELLRIGCDVNPNSPASPLHYPASLSLHSAKEKAELLIAHRADLNSQVKLSGSFALLCYCIQLSAKLWGINSCSGVSQILANLEGMTPLSVAAFTGDQALVQCLLEAGADYSIRNQLGNSPEDLAIALNHPQVAELLAMVSL